MVRKFEEKKREGSLCTGTVNHTAMFLTITPAVIKITGCFKYLTTAQGDLDLDTDASRQLLTQKRLHFSHNYYGCYTVNNFRRLCLSHGYFRYPAMAIWFSHNSFQRPWDSPVTLHTHCSSVFPVAVPSLGVKNPSPTHDC